MTFISCLLRDDLQFLEDLSKLVDAPELEPCAECRRIVTDGDGCHKGVLRNRARSARDGFPWTGKNWRSEWEEVIIIRSCA